MAPGVSGKRCHSEIWGLGKIKVKIALDTRYVLVSVRLM